MIESIRQCRMHPALHSTPRQLAAFTLRRTGEPSTRTRLDTSSASIMIGTVLEAAPELRASRGASAPIPLRPRPKWGAPSSAAYCQVMSAYRALVRTVFFDLDSASLGTGTCYR